MIKSGSRQLVSALIPGASRNIRVLTYHSIDDSGSLLSVSSSELHDQLAALRDLGIRGLTAAEFVDRATKPRRLPAIREVFLTFDDGYENFLFEAAPLLKEFGFPATVFIVPALMGQTACWYERDAASIAALVARVTGSPEAAEHYLAQMQPLATARLLDWSQAKELVAMGFDVASHSHQHHFLSSLPDEQLLADLTESRQSLQDQLQIASDLICYPYGDCDSRVARIAKQAGYRAGFRVAPAASSDPLQLGRWSVAPRMPIGEFRYLFSRASDLEEKLRRFTELG